MTVFDLRELAVIIGNASRNRPHQEAEELITDLWRFLHTKRPDLTLARWRAMVQAAQNVENVAAAEEPGLETA